MMYFSCYYTSIMYIFMYCNVVEHKHHLLQSWPLQLVCSAPPLLYWLVHCLDLGLRGVERGGEGVGEGVGEGAGEGVEEGWRGGGKGWIRVDKGG